jgi:hypothetical protein
MEYGLDQVGGNIEDVSNILKVIAVRLKHFEESLEETLIKLNGINLSEESVSATHLARIADAVETIADNTKFKSRG